MAAQTSPVNFVALIGQALGRMHTLDVGGERVPMLWDVRGAARALACVHLMVVALWH